MNNLITVFDTNTYRNFVLADNKTLLDEKSVREKTENLINRESTKSIKACLAPIVVMELFAHLADPSDPDYENCKMALLAANIHCTEPNKQPRILMDSEVQMCKVLFGEVPKDKIYKDQIDVCRMTYELYYDCKETNMDKWRHNFALLLENVKLQEERFLSDVKKDLYHDIYLSSRNKLEQKKFKRQLYSEINSGELMKNTANGQFERVCNRLGKSLINFGGRLKEDYVNQIKKKFIVPLKFYDNFIKSILDSNGKINLEDESKTNYFWDFNILFCVGDISAEGKEIILISNDMKMHDAAIETGYQNKIMTLQFYLNSFICY